MRFKLFMVVNIETIFVRCFVLRQMDTNMGKKSNASILKEKNPPKIRQNLPLKWWCHTP